jgi:RNA polymerase sigma-70 factor (ECF subfamily)
MDRARKKQIIERFVRENEAYTRSIALRLAPNRSDADDIAQEAYLVAVRRIADLDLEKDIRPWLAGVVRNLCRKAWEKSIREDKLKNDALARFVEDLAGQKPTSKWYDRKDALRKCSERLPSRSRELLNLRYNLDLTSGEIAQKISSTAQAVRTALQRIRYGLRDCIQQEMERMGA